MALPWWLPLGAVPEIPPRQLAGDLANVPGPQVVDVRTGAEFARGHVRGAISVPISALPGRLEALGLDRGRRVVAICLTAHRSIPAVRLLRRAGFDAVQLAGGMLAWRAAGFPEEKGRS
jgi:rhodanese-related sulfurtransferase